MKRSTISGLFWTWLLMFLPTATCAFAEGRFEPDQANTGQLAAETARRVLLVWDTYAQPEVDKVMADLPRDRYSLAKVVVVMIPIIGGPQEARPFSRTFEMNKFNAAAPEGEVTVYTIRTNETEGISLALRDGKWRVGALSVNKEGLVWDADLSKSAPDTTVRQFLFRFVLPNSGNTQLSIIRAMAIAVPERKPPGIRF